MSPGRHAVASAAVGAGIGFIWRDPVAAMAAVLAGTLIDADHLLDYFLNHAGRFTVYRFVTFCNQYRLRKFYLLAHSLDLIIPAVVAAFMFPSPLWVRGAAGAVALHMAMDLYGNGLYIKAYFLSWRILAGFDFRRAVAWLPESGLEYWGSHAAFLRGKPAKAGGAGGHRRRSRVKTGRLAGAGGAHKT
jgi:hypothetical protein